MPRQADKPYTRTRICRRVGGDLGEARRRAPGMPGCVHRKHFSPSASAGAGRRLPQRRQGQRLATRSASTRKCNYAKV